MSFRKNKDGSFWLTLFGLSFSGQIARWRGGPFALAKWGSGDGASIGFAAALFYGLWFHWDIPWRVSRRVPFLRGEEREFGLNWNSGRLSFLFGYQPMGSHYFNRGRLRTIWMNKELDIWRNTWVIGKDHYTSETLDSREIVIDCGRWPGDSYPATQTYEKRTWRNRFRTRERFDFGWSLPSGRHGIPVDTRGKWGDRYSEVYGFGATDTGEGAPAVLAARLKSLLRNWPDGLVADYSDEVTA